MVWPVNNACHLGILSGTVAKTLLNQQKHHHKYFAESACDRETSLRAHEQFVAKLRCDADVVGSFVLMFDFLGGSPSLFWIQGCKCFRSLKQSSSTYCVFTIMICESSGCTE